MKTHAQKRKIKLCPFKIPVSTKYLVFRYYVEMSVKRNIDLLVVVFVRILKDFVTAMFLVRVLAKCCEYNTQPKFYITFLTINI